MVESFCSDPYSLVKWKPTGHTVGLFYALVDNTREERQIEALHTRNAPPAEIAEELCFSVQLFVQHIMSIPSPLKLLYSSVSALKADRRKAMTLAFGSARDKKHLLVLSFNVALE